MEPGPIEESSSEQFNEMLTNTLNENRKSYAKVAGKSGTESTASNPLHLMLRPAKLRCYHRISYRPCSVILDRNNRKITDTSFLSFFRRRNHFDKKLGEGIHLWKTQKTKRMRFFVALDHRRKLLLALWSDVVVPPALHFGERNLNLLLPPEKKGDQFVQQPKP